MDETVAVVLGVRARFETHHQVRVADEAVTALTEAADRRLPGALPGKALLLLDRSAARARAKTWPADAEARMAIRNLDAQIEELNREKEAAVGDRDFVRAAELRDRADALQGEKERLLQQFHERGQVPEAVVDPAIVADVVRELAAQLHSQ